MTQRLVDWFRFVIGPQVDELAAIKGEINKLPIIRPDFGMNDIEMTQYHMGYLYFKDYVEKLKEFAVEAEEKCISLDDALNLLVKQAIEGLREQFPQYPELKYDTMPVDIRERIKKAEGAQERAKILNDWFIIMRSKND